MTRVVSRAVVPFVFAVALPSACHADEGVCSCPPATGGLTVTSSGREMIALSMSGKVARSATSTCSKPGAGTACQVFEVVVEESGTLRLDTRFSDGTVRAFELAITTKSEDVCCTELVADAVPPGGVIDVAVLGDAAGPP